MRPIRLTLQAFGPYAGQEIVDFRDAVASGLFGIYGQTGSGKSTIFGAIHFALFGEATKADQDTASLRSDHADPALPTEVEFVFDVGDKRYMIRRRPEQMRPKQRGAGETRDLHEAWLFDATGLTIDEIGEDNRGRVLAERKTGVVRDAVTALLGFGADQFRQIVLLPQGKFETFLAAKTEDRLSILRELFDVSIYRRLAGKLKDEAFAIERKVRDQRQVCAGRLQADGFEDADALNAGIEAAGTALALASKGETAASQFLAAQRDQRDVGRQRETLFVGAENARGALTALLTRTEEMERAKARLGNARRAQAMADVAAHLADMQGELVRAQAQQSDAEVLAQSQTALAQSAAGTLAKEKERSAESEALQRRIETLLRYRQILLSSAELADAAKLSKNALSIATRALDLNEQALARFTGSRRDADDKLRLARASEAKRQALMSERQSVEAQGKSAAAYETLVGALRDAGTLVEKHRHDHAAAVSRTRLARTAFEQAESELAATQALHLAAKLAPGEPCPVCGSLDHPSLAVGDVEHSGLDHAFREARGHLEHCQALEAEEGRKLSSAETTVKERADRLADLDKPDQAANDLRMRFAGLTSDIAALGPAVDLAAAEAALTKIDEDIASETIKTQAARATCERAKQDEAIARDRLTQALATIPEPLRHDQALSLEQTTVQQQLDARRKALEAADIAASKTREKALTAEAAFLGAKQRCVESHGRRDRARATFEARLLEQGLTAEGYEAFKPWIASIDVDAAMVEDFVRAVDGARRDDALAQAALVDLDRPDLTLLDTAVRSAEIALRDATTARAGAEARLQQLNKLKQSIMDALDALVHLETETAPLRELANMFNAENAQRQDLETFAIGAMFDRVLEAANLRLGPMTSGRYRLEREMEGSGGRARRGLGMKVFDIHTGKARSPATLSGGETFIAALALALGLSDVVESLSGKVRLDTIFIDEGFGSLDTENESGTLDQVLQVLTHLVSQNRTVGLISHVPLVQEAIPNGFYIRKDLHGSHVEPRGGMR